MTPAGSALALQGAFVALAFGWRTLAQSRATGTTGFVAHRERGAAATAAGAALTGGLLTLPVGTALAARRAWGPTSITGTGLMAGGLAVTLLAQRAMGASWRIGVDPEERTELVTDGLFGRVRNPIFSGMLLFAAGTAVSVPTRATLAGLALATTGIVAQVRLVEEPHLRRQHGPGYDAYVASSGRFLPRLA